ncbi:MAG: carboxypeptidase regulatory-like domain-containing protein, partial [Thermoguttaceae bacterium]|nr:carboxypeptidase regulatory-like domain-containing protein [Thermoguttaceae bacterium]
MRVRLKSSRTDKLIVPQEVTIPAGKTSVEFLVASLDNGIVDGEVEITISASGVLENCDCSSPTDSTGYATATLVSLDDDGPKLTLTLDKAIVEEGGKSATLTIKRNTSTESDLTVALASSDETEIALPTTVVIPAGQSSVTLAVAALDDSEVDEDQWVTLEATADGFTRGTALALVTDSSTPDLRVVSLSTPSASVEMGSTIEVAYRVENQGTIPAAVENGAWTEKVWLSRSPSLTSSSTLVATFERSDALSNEPDANAYERTFSVDIPSATGSYYIIVQLDAENVVYESIESNNSLVSQTITAVYTPKYGAVVQTDVEKADPATPIPMRGYAYNLETGERAPNVEVEIFVVTKYGTRSFNVTADETGAFETTWTPLATESGAYTIGAAHPWYTSAPAQDEFSLMKMSAGFTRGSFSIVENATASGSFRIYNESSEPITGLSYDVEGLAENIALDVKFSSSTIPAGGSVEVTLTAKALSASIPTSSAKFRVTSAETNPISGSLSFDVYREDPYLTCDVQTISGSMTRGEQKFVEFTICNESGVESGPVELALPDVAWMSAVGGTTLPSLAPGEVRTVKLLLNPSDDMELTIYRGSFGVNYANTGIKVDYQYRLRADSTGELRVLAVDEYYYHSEEKPTLAGASVKIVDSVTKQVVSTGTTADDGALTIRQLPEGYYDVYVSADGHNNYSQTVYVEAGENELEALLTKQTVRYEWTVTPTTIEDEYEITIETVYEVNVPAPVVTIDPPQMDLSDLLEVGQRKQINFTLTNHGLIAAHDVAPFFEDHPELKFTPLVEILDELPAKSSYVIPVIIERVAASSGSSAVAAEGATGDAASNVGEAVEKYAGIQMNSATFVDEYAARRAEALAATAEATRAAYAEIAAALPAGSRASLSKCYINAGTSYTYICVGTQKVYVPIGAKLPSNFIGSTDSTWGPSVGGGYYGGGGGGGVAKAVGADAHALGVGRGNGLRLHAPKGCFRGGRQGVFRGGAAAAHAPLVHGGDQSVDARRRLVKKALQ